MYIYFDEKVKTRDELQRRRDRGIYVYIYISIQQAGIQFP